MRAEARRRARGSPAPPSRGPRHAAPRSPSRRGLAAALAVGTGLLSSVAAAPAGAGTAPEPTHAPASLTLDLVLVADDGSTATGESFALSAVAPDGLAVIDGHDAEPGAGSALTSVVAAGTYALEQRAADAVRAGHAVGPWSCAGGALAHGLVTVAAGVDAVCTIVVDDLPAILTLLADVQNDDRGTLGAGDVTLTATGAVDVRSGPEGSAAVTDAAVDAGRYAVGAAAVDGYALAGVACWRDPDRAVPLPVDGGVLELVNGGRVVCEVTLDDVPTVPEPEAPPPVQPPVEPPAEPPRLTLDAHVVGDDGGGAVAGDWTLRADGPTLVEGRAGEALVDQPVEPGAYALSSIGPAGYRDLGWSCTAGELVGSTLVLAAGDSASCTVAHDDLPVDLALALDDGGASAANGGSFDLTVALRSIGARGVDRDEPVEVAVQLPVGASIVAAPAGCTAAGGLAVCGVDPTALPTGGGIDLALTARFDPATRAGVHSTIAVVRTRDDPAPDAPDCASASDNVDCEGTELRYPTLTLLQALTTDDGGDATSAQFSLSASGPAGIAGAAGTPAVTVAPVPAGVYRLAATGPPGYGAGSWTCAGAAVEGDTVVLDGLVDVTCTIGHDDAAVDLRLAAQAPSTAPAGGEARVSLVVSNAGGRDVDVDEPVTVTLGLPDGFAHLDGPAWCSAAGRTVTCAVDPASLAAGASVALELLVAVAPGAAAGIHESRAAVTTADDPAPAGGCDASDNVACTQTRVAVGRVSAEASVREQVNGAWVASDGVVGFGDLVQLRIVVRASGDAPSTGVGVVDELPTGLLPDGMAACSVPCTVELDAATARHRITIGTMHPGDVVSITITARVPDTPSQADGTIVRLAFDSAASLSSDNVESARTNVVTMRASHALPAASRSGGDIPIGGISVALALLVAGGLLLVRSRELAPR